MPLGLYYPFYSKDHTDMTKKTVIFVMVLLFLSSAVVPNFVSAMGQSSIISDSVGRGLLAGSVVVFGYHLSSDTMENSTMALWQN
jgi:hypothetical protein